MVGQQGRQRGALSWHAGSTWTDTTAVGTPACAVPDRAARLTARHELKAAVLQAGRQRLGVGQHLALVGHKLGAACLAQRARQASDGVVVRAPLRLRGRAKGRGSAQPTGRQAGSCSVRAVSWRELDHRPMHVPKLTWQHVPCLESGEDGKVDGPLQVVVDGVALLVGALLALAVEDHGATRAAQGLVGGGGHHVRVLKGRGHQACARGARRFGRRAGERRGEWGSPAVPPLG